MNHGLRLLLGAILLFPIAASYACSSEPNRPPPAGQGSAGPPSAVGVVGSNEGGASDAGAEADAAACNAIENNGVVVDRVGVSGDPPVSNGGTIADGRYDLTAYNVYVGIGGITGPTGVTARSSLTILNGRVEQVLEVGGNTANKEVRTVQSYATTGATMLLTNICPASGSAQQLAYTANDVTLTLTDPVAKEAFVFTKR